MKKVITLLLILCLLIISVPISTLSVSAGTYGSMTEQSFINKISQLKNQYPDGKTWNEYNGVDSQGVAIAGNQICPGYNHATGNSCVAEGYCGIHSDDGCTCKCGRFYGWQCHGFANLMAYKVFGSYAISTVSNSSGLNSGAGWTYSTSVSQYYAGDFVRINNFLHSIFIYKVEGNTISYVDCNNTGVPCEIDWGKTISVSELKSKTSYVVHLNGNTLKGVSSTPAPSISYTNISDGDYYIKNKGNGEYLTIQAGIDAEGQRIHTYPYAAEVAVAQTHKIYKVSDGYEIMPFCTSTRVVNPYAWTVESGKTVNLYSKTNESSQWWKFQKVGDAYVIRNVQNPSVCLANATSDDVSVETYTGANSQLWYLEKYCTVKFDANGGSGAPSSQRVCAGQKLTAPTTKPTKKCASFVGWSTTKNSTTASVKAGGKITISKDTTLYAVWTENHDYSPATYTAPKTCKNCGATSGDKLKQENSSGSSSNTPSDTPSSKPPSSISENTTTSTNTSSDTNVESAPSTSLPESSHPDTEGNSVIADTNDINSYSKQPSSDSEDEEEHDKTVLNPLILVIGFVLIAAAAVGSVFLFRKKK